MSTSVQPVDFLFLKFLTSSISCSSVSLIKMEYEFISPMSMILQALAKPRETLTCLNKLNIAASYLFADYRAELYNKSSTIISAISYTGSTTHLKHRCPNQNIAEYPPSPTHPRPTGNGQGKVWMEMQKKNEGTQQGNIINFWLSFITITDCYWTSGHGTLLIDLIEW